MYDFDSARRPRTRSERREQRRLKARRHKVDGRSIFTLARAAARGGRHKRQR